MKKFKEKVTKSEKDVTPTFVRTPATSGVPCESPLVLTESKSFAHFEFWRVLILWKRNVNEKEIIRKWKENKKNKKRKRKGEGIRYRNCNRNKSWSRSRNRNRRRRRSRWKRKRLKIEKINKWKWYTPTFLCPPATSAVPGESRLVFTDGWGELKNLAVYALNFVHMKFRGYKCVPIRFLWRHVSKWEKIRLWKVRNFGKSSSNPIWVISVFLQVWVFHEVLPGTFFETTSSETSYPPPPPDTIRLISQSPTHLTPTKLL